MKSASRKKVEKFVETQKSNLGLNDMEAQQLLDQSLDETEVAEEAADLDMDLDMVQNMNAPAQFAGASAGFQVSRKKGKMRMTDPYLSESQTIMARPTRISKIRSLFFEMALPNEYIVAVGVKDAKPVLGGKFFKIGKRFLKFPAAVQTVYFTSDNANKNYQGLRIDGYACWRVDPEKPETAARNLDFSDTENPMGNTNRILRTICTEAIRHIISNTGIEDALTKKDEIGRDLKAQLERIERTWGIMFDQVGIERVTILSASVFNDLQQKTRDGLRLSAAESRMNTDQVIEKTKAEHTKEMENLHCETEKETRILRATTESDIHKVEIDERAAREEAERKAEEARKKAENEAAERAEEQQAERTKRQTAREADIAAVKAQNELKKAAAEHQNTLKIQELSAQQQMQIFISNHQLEFIKQGAQLQMGAQRFDASLQEQEEQGRIDHAVEMLKLRQMKEEEAVLNRISENRVLAEFVNHLPEIAASINIDRYTVMDGSGTSPLLRSVAQIFHLLEESGIRRFLKESAPADSDSASAEEPGLNDLTNRSPDSDSGSDPDQPAE